MTFRSVVMLLSAAVLLLCGACVSAAMFRGAVANHKPVHLTGTSATEEVNANLQLYKRLLEAAATKDAHVLVFPEFGLYSDTKNRTSLSIIAEQIGAKGGVPCTEFSAEQQLKSPIIFQMSCAAKETKVAALVNMIDYVECSVNDSSDCPEDGFYLYNTNVGLNKNGEFEAKYHKSYEYFGLKPQFNVPESPDYETWTLDEDLEFGLFTCYDIFHEDPPKKYVANGITNFLYPVQMGQIGDITVISHWSKTQKATMFVANSAVVGKADVSAIYVAGDKQHGEIVPISALDGDAESIGSVLVADVLV
jgi:predicted amidohydrolase